MDSENAPLLVIYVTNVHLLESGLSAHSEWTEEGGIIGSEQSAHWYLTGKQEKIHPRHCELFVSDNEFCIRDCCGETFINGSHTPLGKGQMARLAHKDELTVGPYTLKVLIGANDDEFNCHRSLADILGSNEAADLLADGDKNAFNQDTQAPQSKEAELDPPDALHAASLPSIKISSEPEGESLLNRHDNPEKLISNHSSDKPGLSYVPQADSEADITSFIGLKKIHPNTAETLLMDKSELELLEEDMAKNISQDPAGNKSGHHINEHLLSGPMFDGLGVRLSGADDIGRIQLLSHELGESLKVCISGLMELHHNFNSGHFGTVNRNLQPIEDNPLRMGRSYEETIRTMYDEGKSLVHLSAPSAIEESIRNIADHNEAMQLAITEALNYLLRSISPEMLVRRFNQYKRNTGRTVPNDESWSWSMYCNYYQELTSEHQKGFEKLFWEIFEQAYDRKIREKQLEH